MIDNEETGCGGWIIILVFILFSLGAVVFEAYYMEQNGYHREWSELNRTYIWVDKDGKP